MKFVMYLFLFGVFLSAQENILEKYVQTALDGNLALKQKQFSLEQSEAALDEARGMFFPSVSIDARYTRAGGGREIDLPIGDLVNPVYDAINGLTGSNLPHLDNQKIMFMREKEQETKLRLVQPVFQPAIYFNYKAKSNMTGMYRAEKNAFAGTIIAEVKTAYYNYLKTLKIKKLLLSTEELLKENLRVSESLFKNGKATRDAVYKAEAELSKLKQQQSEAGKNNEIAKSYFNFLLNRDFEEEILVEETETPDQPGNGLELAEKAALAKREEITQMQYASEAAGNGVSAAKSSYYPGISLVVDYGYQGEEYKFTNDYDFWTASMVLQWNIFNGFSDKAKAEENEIKKMEIETQKNEIVNKIRLQVREAFYDLEVAADAIETTSKREESSSQSFRIIEKKYKEGMTPQIEYIDARNTLTQSQIEAAVAEYDYKIKLAGLEKATGGFKNEIEKHNIDGVENEK